MSGQHEDAQVKRFLLELWSRRLNTYHIWEPVLSAQQRAEPVQPALVQKPSLFGQQGA